jgi:hypothetical protein
MAVSTLAQKEVFALPLISCGCLVVDIDRTARLGQLGLAVAAKRVLNTLPIDEIDFEHLFLLADGGA